MKSYLKGANELQISDLDILNQMPYSYQHLINKMVDFWRTFFIEWMFITPPSYFILHGLRTTLCKEKSTTNKDITTPSSLSILCLSWMILERIGVAGF